MIKSRNWISPFLLLLASAIWGFAFVAQRIGMDYIEPFTFNGIRFLLGGLVLLPLTKILCNPLEPKYAEYEHNKGRLKFYFWGFASGMALFVGSSLQQVGIVYTQAGNAGFITGFYVILVPVLGMFMGKKTPLIFWFASGLAIMGMYFLCIDQGLSVNHGDLFVLFSAVAFAVHVLLIDHVTKIFDAIKISVFQFLTCGACSLLVAICCETIRFSDIRQASMPILYGGLMSVGVGYTLQSVGQKNTAPGPAVIMLSAESVFAVIGGVWLLGETIDFRGLLGCGLMLAGMILAQKPSFDNNNRLA